MLLYVVSFEGLLEGYGAEYYLLGIFDDSDEAILAKEIFDRDHEQFGITAEIEEVVLNQEYDVRVDKGKAVTTPIFIGGYTE